MQLPTHESPSDSRPAPPPTTLLVGSALIAEAELLAKALRDGRHTVTKIDGTSTTSLEEASSAGLLVLAFCGTVHAGATMIQEFRAGGATVPLMVVTETKSAEEAVRYLDAGADDCVSWPVSPDELHARLRALARRYLTHVPHFLQNGPLRFDTSGRMAFLDGRHVGLTATELSLLELFMRRPGRLIAKRQLSTLLCELRSEVTGNAIEVYVHRLRRKIADDRVRINTIRGVGYCLQPA